MEGGDRMDLALSSVLIALMIGIPLLALFLYLIVLIIRALRKYIKSGPARKEAQQVRRSLAEKLREKSDALSDVAGICSRSGGGQPTSGEQMGIGHRVSRNRQNNRAVQDV